MSSLRNEIKNEHVAERREIRQPTIHIAESTCLTFFRVMQPTCPIDRNITLVATQSSSSL